MPAMPTRVSASATGRRRSRSRWRTTAGSRRRRALAATAWPGCASGSPSTVAGSTPHAGSEAVAEAARLRPEVVLMDVRMPVLDGIEATRRIIRAGHSTRVMILTTFGLDGYVYDALRAGASGFMLKDARPEEIAAGVRIVASGDALLAPAVTRAVIEEFARKPGPPTEIEPPAAVAELTPREQEVLALLVRE